MELWIGRDSDGFAARAKRFVTATIEHNVLATVLDSVQAGHHPEAVFAVATDADGATVGAAIRTAPHALLAAGRFDEPRAFWEAWLGLDPLPSGVSAETALARALAEAWTELTGGRTELGVSEAMHVLSTVVPPQRPAPGGLRPAGFRDSAQLEAWAAAFAVDAGIPHVEAIVAGVRHAIEQDRFHVWELEGRAVTMIGHTVTVAGVVRIGPVYTPAELRGHGYATAATAALSQRLLDRGAQRCMLYTDLANPISNHIYAKIGYVRTGDWEVLEFRPGVL